MVLVWGEYIHFPDSWQKLTHKLNLGFGKRRVSNKRGKRNLVLRVVYIEYMNVVGTRRKPETRAIFWLY